MAKSGIIAKFSAVLAVVLLLTAVQAFAEGQDDVLVQDIVVLTAGNESESKFYLDDVFSPLELGPMATFMVMTMGNAETLYMDFALDPDDELEKEWTDTLKGALAGVGYSTDGTITPFFGSSVEVPINSGFGFVFFEALITQKNGRGLSRAIPCSVSFALTVMEEEE
jgi:hypothetical protein